MGSTGLNIAWWIGTNRDGGKHAQWVWGMKKKKKKTHIYTRATDWMAHVQTSL
jgi:hypothetical protein